MLRVVFNQELRIPQNMHEHPNFDYPWPVIIHASALDVVSLVERLLWWMCSYLFSLKKQLRLCILQNEYER